MEHGVSWLFIVWACALGACLGSFCGVCVERYVGAQGLGGRSMCVSCRRPLPPQHLVPILSWLWLRGRCGLCGAPIGWFCPGIETVSMLAGGCCALVFGWSVAFFAAMGLAAVLIVVSAIDLRLWILPDVFTLPLAVVALPLAVTCFGLHWMDSLIGGLAGAGLLWVLRAVFKLWRGVEGLGLGDVKLMLSLGCLTGVWNLPVLLLVSSLTGVGVALCRVRPNVPLGQTPIPFGPFLSAGCFAVVLGNAGHWGAYW